MNLLTQKRIDFIKKHPEYTVVEMAEVLGVSDRTAKKICHYYELDFKKRRSQNNPKAQVKGTRYFNVYSRQNWLV